MVLSGNAIEHGMLMLACFTAGIPVAPVSVAYSLQSQDHAKLKDIVRLLTPGLVYVADTAPFAKPLAALDLVGRRGGGRRNGARLEQRHAVRSARGEPQPGPRSRKPSPRSAPDTIVEIPVHVGLNGNSQGASSTRTA